MTWGPEQVVSESYGKMPHLAKKGNTVNMVFYRTEEIGPDRYWDFIKYMRDDNVTGINEHETTLKPEMINLSAYPNPFNGETKINFNGYKGGEAKLSIYNIRGQLVRVMRMRENTATWDAKDNQGNSIVSGIYIAKVSMPQGASFTKFVYLK